MLIAALAAAHLLGVEFAPRVLIAADHSLLLRVFETFSAAAWLCFHVHFSLLVDVKRLSPEG